MSITGTQATTETSTTPPSGQLGTRQVDKQEFLMLLVAQLRNQDPLNPIEDRDFIAQLAQFNVLEQMQQMNQTLTASAELTTLGQLATFVGKQVVAISNDGEGLVEGVVTGVTIVDGTPMLAVNGGYVDVRNVMSINAAAAEPAEPEVPPASDPPAGDAAPDEPAEAAQP